jgi:hypothetical protein
MWIPPVFKILAILAAIVWMLELASSIPEEFRLIRDILKEIWDYLTY